MSVPHRARLVFKALLAPALFWLVGAAAGGFAPAAPASLGTSPRDLTFDERVRAQEAIERVYYAHQTGATRPFEEAVPRAVLQTKVRAYLRRSVALDRFWHTPVTAEALDRETARIVANSRLPERLEEMYAALGGNAFLFQETIVRAALVERLTRRFAEHDERWAGALDPAASWGEALAALDPDDATVVADPSEPAPLARATASCIPDDTWNNGSLDDVPDNRTVHTAVWTGSVMIIWGGGMTNSYNTGGRYDPVTDSWSPTSTQGAPSPRALHTAVWTGSEMIVWGGLNDAFAVLNSGGRYDPVSDAWSSLSTTGAPAPRYRHAAIWTGSEMIVWGGAKPLSSARFNSGGRYDPATNSWSSTSLVGAPPARSGHTAVWTGTRMVVWGGNDGSADPYLIGGGRYDPATDSWLATNVSSTPAGRESHTAVWTGTEMILWGGYDSFTYLNTGGRYNPATDTWSPTSTTNALRRQGHTSVWTGSRMLIWGGITYGSPAVTPGASYNPATDQWQALPTTNAPASREGPTGVWTGTQMIVWGGGSNGSNTGGRYTPATASWTPTAVPASPSGRSRHTAVWTGNRLIVWGGWGPVELDTGGAYDPATDSWTATSTVLAPTPRVAHTAVWTGNEMIVWGGDHNGSVTDTGGRYDPIADLWAPTSQTGAPAAVSNHTAIWTGSSMIVWGGDPILVGSRYDPVVDQWAPISMINAPAEPRILHTAVWTGSRMVIWGGITLGTGYLNTGGRYDPASDTWQPTSIAGAPQGRYHHGSVWTGSEMIVWGGRDGLSFFGSGGRYDPATDLWTPTSAIAAPASREGHTQIWTGHRMIVWGGGRSYGRADGGIYDPATNSWSPTSQSLAPTGRSDHAAVWAAGQMIVWGGTQFSNIYSLDSGGRYALGQALDLDGDGYSTCGGDCDDGNAGAFAAPAEIGGLAVSMPGAITWNSAAPGAGIGTVHDVLRGLAGELPVGAGGSETCLLSGGAGTTVNDAMMPAPGQAYFYLVRGRNACARGAYGFASSGAERLSTRCP